MDFIYLVDPVSKQPQKVVPVAFSDLQIKERQDLQEWVVNHPELLGEPLLVVTTEYDGFDRSSRRLDVLALDLNGKLVIVELKLDIERSHADLQAIRYAAFCSTMTMRDVIEEFAEYKNLSPEDAEFQIIEFLDVDDLPELDTEPRIILAAGAVNDQEITSTVLWLRKFGMDVSCVELTPYRLEQGTIILVPKILIPLPETEAYQVRVERKEVIKRQSKRSADMYLHLWEAIADAFNDFGLPYTAKPPKDGYYMQLRVGVSGMHYEWMLRKRKGLLFVAIHFESSNAEQNRERLRQVLEHGESLEKKTGYALESERFGSKGWTEASFRLTFDGTRPLEKVELAAKLMTQLVNETLPGFSE